mgnify:CR=1 FL=1
MSNIALPMLFALLLWWFSTGVILYLDSLPRRSFRWSLAGASVLAMLALVGVAQSSSMATPAGAYLAFTAAVTIWGWLEMSYLMGWITGPWRKPCPPGVTGFARFKLALRTSLYHEAAVTAVGATLLVLCRDVANPLAAHIFLVLWLMRWSSKLNVFLGVPNLNEEFLPEQLGYLTSFMPRRPMNLFFPLAVTVATVITAQLFHAAATAESDSFAATADSLLAALMLLAVLEHWFLVLPLQDATLWRWALQVRQRRVHIEPQLAVTPATGE